MSNERFFTIYANRWVRIDGYVEADTREEAIEKIRSGDFYVSRSETMEEDVDMDTLDLEPFEEEGEEE